MEEKKTMSEVPEETGERTFTQEEVNRIISERLSRDRDKRAAELDAREKAIKARELAVVAAEKLAAVGLPQDLTAVLKYDDEASLDEAITKLSNMRGFANGKDTKKKTYEEFKLPQGAGVEPKDPIREAFKLRRE